MKKKKNKKIKNPLFMDTDEFLCYMDEKDFDKDFWLEHYSYDTRNALKGMLRQIKEYSKKERD